MRKKWGLVFTMILIFSSAALAGGRMKGVPPPNLIAPGDNEDITGKETVEFRWSGEGDRATMDYYDFRLYKGNQPYEASLILKDKIAPDKTSTQVKADLFTPGETYNWSVRKNGSQKSRTAYSVFKVVKPHS